MEDHAYYLSRIKRRIVNVSTWKNALGTSWSLHVLIHAWKRRGNGGAFIWMEITFGQAMNQISRFNLKMLTMRQGARYIVSDSGGG